MLRLKRASAGSGKTYELAKTYIKLLITAKKPGYRRQLRRDEDFREALSAIMAVTFTVKATAEMKQRIVEKLYDLSRADNADPEERKKIDYLDELIRDFGSNEVEIARLAQGALRTLLLHFSDFKVQTIDSFFQSILHTFAYEASLDDNFNVEINTDMVTSAGFDIALDNLSESSTKDSEMMFWLNRIIGSKMEGNTWNVFRRDPSKRSLYSALISEAKNLEKEDYQKVRNALAEYFSTLDENKPFSKIAEDVDAANLGKWETYHAERRRLAEALLDRLAKAGLDASGIGNYMEKSVKESLADFDIEKLTPPSKRAASRDEAGGSLKKNVVSDLKKIYGKGLAEAVGPIDEAFAAWADAHNAYFDEFEREKIGVNTWLAYRRMLPSLMLVMEIAARKDEYLKATNSMQISDTTHILSSIIGEDDTPFVYERMGARLRHFLIDEFQDTSRMQWRNLKPLLQESESTGNENLIIGDVKQSIYRFRNADFTLITSLEKEFSDVVPYTQEKKPDGDLSRTTNFRSMPRIVEFNNFIFSSLAGPASGDSSLFTPAIRDIYRDCVQNIHPKKRDVPEEREKGYVELTFYPAKAEDSEESNSADSASSEPGFRDLPEKILSLRQRGYRFRDIAVLVPSHREGSAALEALSAHNAAHPDNPIPVISEEDLLVGSALSVKIIIHALEMAAGLTKDSAIDNPALTDVVREEELFSLLRAQNTMALPALVEAIVGKFVPEERKRAETPFIAAFQDAVIDYSISRSSDIGSFLKWWRQKSKKISITSPEDSDGVTLQTIHKSKGLEYMCVIIPKADFSFKPGNHSEWRWVPVSPLVAGHELLPPYLPVKTSKALEGTAHAGEWTRYQEEYALDELNKIYVAFTRAAWELYVWFPTPKSASASKASAEILRVLGSEERDPDGLLGTQLDMREEEGGTIKVTYGKEAAPAQIEAEYEREKDSEPLKEKIALESYQTSISDPVAQNDHPLKTIIHPDGTEEEIDPRAEGTLKHRVMQMVATPADLPKALRSLRVAGFISAEKVREWGVELSAAIDGVSSRRWFAPEMRVFNERALIKRSMKGSRRPDRFIVSPEGDAVIIDYKFGAEEGSYKRQVREYASLLRETGLFSSVRAYLWYIPTGKVEEVK